MRNHICTGKTAYIWIFPDPTKAKPTLGVVLVGIIVEMVVSTVLARQVKKKQILVYIVNHALI